MRIADKKKIGNRLSREIENGRRQDKSSFRNRNVDLLEAIISKFQVSISCLFPSGKFILSNALGAKPILSRILENICCSCPRKLVKLWLWKNNMGGRVSGLFFLCFASKNCPSYTDHVTVCPSIFIRRGFSMASFRSAVFRPGFRFLQPLPPLPLPPTTS